VLDSAGYGPVTIAKSVSITAPTGIYAGISVFSGQTGVTVDGSGIVVALRGLTINGQGGLVGVSFVQGATLMIEDCEVANLIDTGIAATAANSHVFVRNTVIRDNSSNGFSASAGEAVLDRVHINTNGDSGVVAAGGSKITVTDSVLANNSAGAFVAASAGVVSDLMITKSTVVGSTSGLQAGAGPGSTARLVSDATAINNSTNAAFDFGGAGTTIIYSAGNNTVGFNNGIVSGGALTPIGTH
jgi:hypothetical protein